MLRSICQIVLLIPLILGIPAYCAAVATPSAASLEDVNFQLYSTRRPVNNLPLSDIAGHPVSLDSLKGNVVILNFWRIDCRPCSAEKPLLERLYRKYSDRGLKILAVNLSDRPDRVKDYVSHGGYTFTFAYDPGDQLSLRMHRLPSGTATSFVVNSNSEAIYEIPGVPTSYLIDRDGLLVGRSTGLTNWDRGPLRTLLESLLGPRKLSAANPKFYSPRSVIEAVAQTGSPESVAPSAPQRGAVPGVSAQAGKVIIAQHPLPMEGDAPPKSPVVAPPSPPAPPAVPQRRTPRPTTVAPGPPPGTSSRSAVSPTRQPSSARPLPRTSTRNRPPANTYRPGSAGSSYPAPSTSPRYPVARSVRPGRSDQTPASNQLPVLPKALPYGRGSAEAVPDQTGQPVQLDKNGYITARVPDGRRPLPETTRRAPSGIPEAEPLPPAMDTRRRTLPSADPLRPSNPIGGFILESFSGDSRPPSPLARQPLRVQPRMPQQPQQQFPSRQYQQPSFLGRVKDTLGRLNPFQ